MVVVERATGEDGGTHGLELGIGNAHTAGVVEEAGRVGVLLGLDDFVEDGVDVCRGDVCGVAAVVAQGADEGRVVVLLADGWVGAGGYETGAEGIGEDCAVVVWRERDFVGEMLPGGGPVLQCPLGVDGAGGPGDCGDL